MQFSLCIQNFTDVYREQPFMQRLQEEPGVYWMDCREISGTDCYCDDDAQAEIIKMMGTIGSQPGVHFFDNGNYHYISKLWTDCLTEDFDLVIFDHHPDMQPPRFEGILSCGGWVKEVFDKNPHIGNVVLIGVADHLVEEIKNDPTAEFEKYESRVTFIKESEVRENNIVIGCGLRPVYVSIDKDALCLSEAVTNWDQGSLTFAQLEQVLRELFSSRKILGVDICGERARNQDYADGIDEGTADALNNELNKKIFQLIKELFAG